MFATQNLLAARNIPEDVCRLIAEFLPCQDILQKAETIEHHLTAKLGSEMNAVEFSIDDDDWYTQIRGRPPPDTWDRAQFGLRAPRGPLRYY